MALFLLKIFKLIQRKGNGGLFDSSHQDNGILGWLVDIGLAICLRLPAEGPHYIWGTTKGSVHT